MRLKIAGWNLNLAFIFLLPVVEALALPVTTGHHVRDVSTWRLQTKNGRVFGVSLKLKMKIIACTITYGMELVSRF